MRVDLTRRFDSSVPPDISGITLRLSRRNLLALLHMLDKRDKAMPALSGRDQHIEILVLPEEDETHYAEHVAGAMSWEDNPCACDGGGGIMHAPGPKCTVWHPQFNT